METAFNIWPYVASIIGTLILILIGIIGFFSRRWIKGVADTQDKILKSIDAIKDDIATAKVDLQFQNNYINELETRMHERS